MAVWEFAGWGDDIDKYTCSECHGLVITKKNFDMRHYAYCPLCGKEMDCSFKAREKEFQGHEPRKIMVLCPTVARARQECCQFCKRYRKLIKKYTMLAVEMINGDKIWFRAKTEGQREVRGFRGEIIELEDFCKKEVEGEELCH